MSKYLVKLTPTGKFFFGGDMRFGINGEKEEFTSYIIESSKMPQQTSLLGMMRFLLLSNSELFDTAANAISGKKADVDKLIGEKSFTVNADKSANSFGEIASVGPCFVYCKKNGARYFRAPADHLFTTIDWEQTVPTVINGKSVMLPQLKVWDKEKNEEKLFTGKEYLAPYFAAPFSKGCEPIEEEKLFTEDRRIGIEKDYEGKSKTNALYKQISYRLAEGYCFAFEVETEHDISEKKYRNQLVSLGADSSTFVFEAEKIETASQASSKDGTAVVLLSDAYIPETPEYSFAINSMRTFRFLETVNTKDASYHRINGKNKPTVSTRYELYEAGSVFYFENAETREKFCKALEERQDFNQIGYNRYYIK